MTVGLMQDSKAYPASRLTSEARKPRTCITPTMLAVFQRLLVAFLVRTG